MGKGAQQFDSSVASQSRQTRQVVTASYEYRAEGAGGNDTHRGKAQNGEGRLAATTDTMAKTTTRGGGDGVSGVTRDKIAYDVTLVNGRTAGDLPEGHDDASRAAVAERRLLETQQVLVRERMAREIAEAILSETSKALSAVRRAAEEGGRATSVGVSLRGGGEEAATYLTERLNLLRADYDTLRAETVHKDQAIARMTREAAQTEEGANRLAAGKPVTINLDIREITTRDQDELVLASKVLLDRAHAMARSVGELRAVDEQRIRTIAEMVTTMEAHQAELKDKLRDAGLLDEEEYNDEQVGALGVQGVRRAQTGSEHLGHLAGVQTDVRYDPPAASPLGKNFYATRTVSWLDRWFGIWV
mmetsp:Transcript_22575/g.55889  ORF Transcript_22575/g.55889 Transcript_22575/m.55889 type:complete len:360 (-) Transcript_22575:953-2032(-)|eukprot:CAMPEP_0181354608 /NCGR_PEP_ID=MMETSP1106-20121128/3449_1 /TAXON_ID=81844 /ORGANISM="Mantoniella antarctica, Strain SL-175" /LENGTH=359 /DNA_ID=CAMNT_0023467277 /DNA_START=378 /DNA_END=1457 /DNA_ORIENTATION=-